MCGLRSRHVDNNWAGKLYLHASLKCRQSHHFLWNYLLTSHSNAHTKCKECDECVVTRSNHPLPTNIPSNERERDVVYRWFVVCRFDTKVQWKQKHTKRGHEMLEWRYSGHSCNSKDSWMCTQNGRIPRTETFFPFITAPMHRMNGIFLLRSVAKHTDKRTQHYFAVDTESVRRALLFALTTARMQNVYFRLKFIEHSRKLPWWKSIFSMPQPKSFVLNQHRGDSIPGTRKICNMKWREEW